MLPPHDLCRLLSLLCLILLWRFQCFVIETQGIVIPRMLLPELLLIFSIYKAHLGDDSTDPRL